METQDGFFCRLAGQSALTGLAIDQWIGYINTIKILKFSEDIFTNEGDLKVYVKM